MGDWKKELGKQYPSAGGGGATATKKCEKCGKPLKDDKFKYCWDCNEKMKAGGGGTATGSGLPKDYLAQGYFDDKGNLFVRYIARGGDADDIAKQLGTARPAMTTHQLRRFYGHVRAADNRLKMTGNFSSVYIDLKKLEPFVSEAKGKGKIPDIFFNFMTGNLAALKTEKDFTNGFLEHFQAVVAFFTFHHPKK